MLDLIPSSFTNCTAVVIVIFPQLFDKSSLQICNSRVVQDLKHV